MMLYKNITKSLSIGNKIVQLAGKSINSTVYKEYNCFI